MQFVNPISCMKCPLGGVNPSPNYMCRVDHLIPPSLLSHDSCIVRTDLPSLSLAVMVGLLTQSSEKKSPVPRITITWTCDQLDRFSLIIIFIDNSPFINLMKKSKLTLVWVITTSVSI
jgi:hypothetical protein